MLQPGYLRQTVNAVQGQILKTTNYAFNTRGKKLAWVGVLAVMLLIYWNSSLLMPIHRQFKGSGKHDIPCLQRELEKWLNLAHTSNIVIKYPNHDSSEKNFLPFTGNGYIGMVVDGKDMTLYLQDKGGTQQLKIPLISHLRLRIEQQAFSIHDAVVLNIQEGVIHLYRAYAGSKSCVLVKHTVFVHRKHSGILVQQLTVSNLLEDALKVAVEPLSNKDWKQSTSEELRFVRNDKEKDTQSLYHGFVGSDSSSTKTYAAVSVSSFPKELVIPVKSYKKLNVLMMVAATEIPVVISTPASKSEAKKEKLMKETIDASKAGLRQFLGLTKPSVIYEEHVNAWKEVWELGLSLESKDDPDSPFPLHVNLTEYYLYSLITFSANKSNNIDLSTKRRRQLNMQTRTRSCFYGPPTMYSVDHWALPKTMDGLTSLQQKWADTLRGHGCGSLLEAGLFGWQEAVALSFSGLQFTDRGLELALNPLSLASNVSVRHLPCFTRQIFLQIVIDKLHDKQNVQLSSYGVSKSKLYACDAGCEHISELKTAVISFEIRVTTPVTPILYVSPNRTKLEMIQKSKFILVSKQGVKSGNIPSFAAHHFKLSPKFWLAVGILITGFHVIVIKMIYNECRKDRGRRNKGRPFVS